jgi:hypothetical protein
MPYGTLRALSKPEPHGTKLSFAIADAEEQRLSLTQSD